jgi:multicomponent K+:H+ antiporter subunit D
MLCFPDDAGPSASFGGNFLIWGGITTLAFGAVGMLASHQLARLTGYAVISSSGILIAAFGFSSPALSGGALYYLLSSTLAACALYLLVELLERARHFEIDRQQLDDGKQALPSFAEAELPIDVNLDDDRMPLIGRPIPAALVFLGLAFAATALAIAGLPPLSGFVAKLALLSALLEIGTLPAWTLFGLLIVSGLLGAIALIRVGIRHFWITQERPAPHLRLIEGLPIAALLLAVLALVIFAEPVLQLTKDTADSLQNNDLYIDAVLGARPVTEDRG